MNKLFWIIFVEKIFSNCVFITIITHSFQYEQIILNNICRKDTKCSLSEKISQSFLLFYLGFMVVDKKGKEAENNLFQTYCPRLTWDYLDILCRRRTFFSP